MTSNKKLYHFDSFRRTTFLNEEPTFVIPSSGIYSNSFEIEHINIPTTWYNINSTNNILLWTDTLAASVTTTITPGNYTATELATQLGTQMTADETVGDTYTVTWDTTIQKFTIAGDGGNFTIDFVNAAIQWDKNSPSRNLAKLLGFYLGTTAITSSGTYFSLLQVLNGAATYTGTSVAYINIRNVTIRSNLMNQCIDHTSRTLVTKLTSAGTAIVSDGKNDILKILPYNVDQGDQIIYRPNFPELYALDKRDGITHVTFKLEDDFGNILNLNGQSWSISLSFNNNL